MLMNKMTKSLGEVRLNVRPLRISTQGILTHCARYHGGSDVRIREHPRSLCAIAVRQM